jgi:hypothetical protein
MYIFAAYFKRNLYIERLKDYVRFSYHIFRSWSSQEKRKPNEKGLFNYYLLKEAGLIPKAHPF